MNRPLLIFFLIIVIPLTIFLPVETGFSDFTEFRVVLNPGHGGISMHPRALHGDKYDILSGKFLDPYREGAAYRKNWEHIIVYRIAQKVKKLLEYCSKDGDFNKFKKILKHYTNEEPKRIIINTILSRGDSSNRKAIKQRKDPNGEFRLFDYIDKNGKTIPGRISRINAFKPHLVVSLHLAASSPPEYRGYNPVIVAPYSLLLQGLRYLKGEVKSSSILNKTPYADWFSEANGRTDFEWFLKDTSVYFTGYSVKGKNEARGGKKKKRRSGKRGRYKRGIYKDIDRNNFRGYRYNMVSWVYKDDNGWDKVASKHPDYTPYSSSYKTYKADSKFWEREKSVYEEYRRQGGPEGYGGDNLYASSEIIRYILNSLNQNMKLRPNREQRLARPYVSIWSLPLHINAVSAFIELGYLNRPRLRYILTRQQEALAEGIAVGIYSLLAGMNSKNKKFKYSPRGVKLNLEKYKINGYESYFDQVVTE